MVWKSDAGAYRYGFNGKEHEDDLTGGDYDFGARIYDSRIAKFLSIDPLMSVYAWQTPYAFAANCPITCSDEDGLGYIIKIYSRTISNAIAAIVLDNNKTIEQKELEIQVIVNNYKGKIFTKAQQSWLKIIDRNHSSSSSVIEVFSDGNSDNTITIYGLVGANYTNGSSMQYIATLSDMNTSHVVDLTDPNNNVGRDLMEWSGKGGTILEGMATAAELGYVTSKTFNNLSKFGKVLGPVGTALSYASLAHDSYHKGEVSMLDIMSTACSTAGTVAVFIPGGQFVAVAFYTISLVIEVVKLIDGDNHRILTPKENTIDTKKIMPHKQKTENTKKRTLNTNKNLNYSGETKSGKKK